MRRPPGNLNLTRQIASLHAMILTLLTVRNLMIRTLNALLVAIHALGRRRHLDIGDVEMREPALQLGNGLFGLGLEKGDEDVFVVRSAAHDEERHKSQRVDIRDYHKAVTVLAAGGEQRHKRLSEDEVG